MCSLKDSQNNIISIQSSPLHIAYLFSIPSNLFIVDIEYLQGICSYNFIVDDFLKLFLHLSIPLIKDSRMRNLKTLKHSR